MREAILKARLEILFPNLMQAGYEITSPNNHRYNCIAWAADEDNIWWEPVEFPGVYWPAGVTMAATLDAYIEAYESIGYQICMDDSIEVDYEKIALFAKDSLPMHASKQLETGEWTSKLG